MRLNYDSMKGICFAAIKDFRQIGKVTDTKDGAYVFIDRKAPVLAVAHLDSVQSSKHFYHITVGGEEYILNAQLDDRLGVYIILGLLFDSLNYDILLTEGEETGSSTARHFKTNKKYNWMFSFDRRGADVVTYQYGSKKLKEMLGKAGFNDINHGSFSDIAVLDDLGCEGFNVGCGYDNEHSLWASARVDKLLSQAKKFVEFHKRFKNVKFEYKPATIVHSPTHVYSARGAWLPHGSFADYGGWDGNGFPTSAYNCRPEGMSKKQFKRWKYQHRYDLGTSNAERETCDFCGRPLIEIDRKAKHKNACLACDPNIEQCVICAGDSLISQLEEGICKGCISRITSGYPQYSHIRCPQCGDRLMTTELKAKKCVKCRYDLTDVPKLPDVNEDVFDY